MLGSRAPGTAFINVEIPSTCALMEMPRGLSDSPLLVFTAGESVVLFRLCTRLGRGEMAAWFEAVTAALAAGAAGVRVGTRFLAAEEAATQPRYVQALIEANPEDTELTDLFSVMWPSPEPHRVLRSCIERARGFEGDSTGEIRLDSRTLVIPRFGIPCPTKTTTGTVEAMALYAGQSVEAVKRLQPAAGIVHELTARVESLLRCWT